MTRLWFRPFLGGARHGTLVWLALVQFFVCPKPLTELGIRNLIGDKGSAVRFCQQVLLLFRNEPLEVHLLAIGGQLLASMILRAS